MRADLGRTYEVYWNGVNDDADGDLLNVSLRVTPKRRPGPAPAKPVPVGGRRIMHEVVLHALPWRKRDALDYPALMARTQFSRNQVNSALGILRRKHHVASEVIKRFKTWRNRAPQRYWRVAP